MSLQQQVITEFTRRFDSSPAFVVRAPGRVNLIGEHTDYNGGFVLPLAIDRAMWIALQPQSGSQVTLYSINQDDELAFDLSDITHTNAGWGEYVKGVARMLRDDGYPLRGWRGVMVSDVPMGAGLSSSAALELAIARTFAAVSGFEWEPATMAKIGQRAENDWVGVNCGIMDQMISAAGVADHALLIDCRTLETEPAPLPPGSAVVVMNTTVRRGLVDSAYNERRSQCETAADFFGVSTLRDVDGATFAAQQTDLDSLTRQRAQHVITENERVLAAIAAMKAGDVATLGRLMDESHVSMRDDFEISCPELDAMVEAAQATEGCFGARMTGGGFGGCAVALVDAAQADAFAAQVAAQYQTATGLTPELYICAATNGAAIIVDGV